MLGVWTSLQIPYCGYLKLFPYQGVQDRQREGWTTNSRDSEDLKGSQRVFVGNGETTDTYCLKKTKNVKPKCRSITE